jgi:hypothetical protein
MHDKIIIIRFGLNLGIKKSYLVVRKHDICLLGSHAANDLGQLMV